MIVGGPNLRAQLRASDWRLRLMLQTAAEFAEHRGCHLRLTSVERTRKETRRIYRESGREGPAGPSVHDVRPCRGADVVPEPFKPDVSVTAVGIDLADWINRLYHYPRGRSSALWHDVSGFHLHFQVPWDGMEIVPDPTVSFLLEEG